MQQTQNQIPGVILYILAWLICSAIIIVDVLAVRQATLDIMTAVQVERVENSQDKAETRLNAGFVKEVVDRGLIIGGGVAAVGLALYIEYYFRMGRQQGKLLARIGKVLAMLIAVFAVSTLIQVLV